MPQDMHAEQVRNLLKFIEASQNQVVVEQVFRRLGHECFFSRKLDEWVKPYQGAVQAFLDRVNVEKASRYWERLEFNPDGSILELTGKKVEECACAFADCPQPPLSLCHYCCQHFQQELFGSLLGREVRVEITAAFLLGDERCSTRIHLL